MSMTAFERPRSLTELVADRLRQDIVDGVFDFGEALSESTIAKRLEVSRTPVREAFARLELEGLVRSKPQSGTFVFQMSRDELIAICDVRVILETGALQLAALRDQKRLARKLSKTVERMTRARERRDDRTYLALDTEFHQTLVDCADNRYLCDVYQTIAPRMAALRNRLGNHADHMAKSFDEHRAIAARIADRDVDAATQILISHIGRKEGSYWNI